VFVRNQDNPTSDMARQPVSALLLIGSVALSAYLMGEAIASPGMGWLAWVSLLPLFLVIRVLAPLRALLCGALWGACLGAFAPDRPIDCSSVHSLALLGAVPAAYAYLGALLTRRVGFSPLVLAFGWVGVEFALQPLHLRCGLLAGTQGDGVLVLWVGSLLGYVFVAFLVAYVNALLLALLIEVRFNASAPRCCPRSDNLKGRPEPGSFWCLSALALRAAQPRAPPSLA